VFSKYHTDWLFKLYVPYLPLLITLSALARRVLSPADCEMAWLHVDSTLALYGQQDVSDTRTSPMWQIIHQMKKQAAVYVKVSEHSIRPNTSLPGVHNLSDSTSQSWNQMADMDPYYMQGDMMFDVFSNDITENNFIQQSAYDEGHMTSNR